MTVNEVLQSQQSVPLEKSIVPITEALMGSTVFLGVSEESKDSLPPSDGSWFKPGNVSVQIRTGADKYGRAWVYAYTTEEHFWNALGSAPFLEMSFVEFFDLVDKNPQFAGMMLDSKSAGSCPIPREMFEQMRQILRVQ